MADIEISTSDSIAAPTEEVWRILGEEFLDISVWAGGVAESGPNPVVTPLEDGPPSGGRVCVIPGFGTTDERITEFDRSSRSLAYTITATKVPGFVKGMGNRWSVEDDGRGGSTVTATVTARATGVLGALMGPMLKRNMGKSLTGLLGDLRTYAETGSPAGVK